MVSTVITPVAQRRLSNRTSFGLVVRNTLTFVYRSMLKAIKNPESFVDITLMPIMFTLMFTFLFGGAVSGSIEGYLPIIIPGILMQTLITSCGTAGTQLREDADKSVANRFKSMPVARIAPLAGVLTADLLRYVIASTIVFGMGAILGFRPEAGFGAIIASIAFIMVITWCLSWVFAFIGMVVRSVATAQMFGMILMFPLTFLSNAFVPTSTMPSWLGFFAENINPLSRAVTAIREMLSFGTVGSDFWLALAGASVLLAVFAPLTLHFYNRKA